MNKPIYGTKCALTRGPWAVMSGEFYTTKEVAIAECERLRYEKIASLKKKIADLEMMEFKL